MLFIVISAFAALGFGYSLLALYHYVRVPSAFSKPHAFLILEIHHTGDLKPFAKIYLDSPNPQDVQFEGPKLSYQQAGIAHRQSAVPLPGFIVSGSGRVIYGKSVIDIGENGDIIINGDWVNASDFTVGKNGTHRNGEILIAR